MSSGNSSIDSEKTNYSKFLSALFSSLSILGLSMLCLLNNPVLDLYSAYTLVKVVVPASFCSWFLGFVIGKKLDSLNVTIVRKVIVSEKKAYEIPSMFSSTDMESLSSDVPTDEMEIL